MFWLTWQMWILLALALLGGGVVGWLARARSDEADKGGAPDAHAADQEPSTRVAAADKSEAAGRETAKPASPSTSPANEADGKSDARVKAAAPPQPSPDTPAHAEGEGTHASQAGPDPVAVGGIAPAAPSEPEEGVKRETRDTAVAAGEDDLTQIKGLGPKAAEKLREAGVHTIGEIACWSDEDIDRYDKMIAGRGRIRRDDWVGQAREMAGSTP